MEILKALIYEFNRMELFSDILLSYRFVKFFGFRFLFGHFGSRISIMKLDTSGLESTAPIFASSSELLNGLSTAPSFDLPSNVDVSFNMFCLYFLMDNSEVVLTS